jgi:hypothetical protein
MIRSKTRRLARLLVAGVAFSVTGLGMPEVGRARGSMLDCGRCTERVTGSGVEHAFTGSCAGGGSDCNYCSAPGDGFGCHIGWKTGDCVDYHDSCPAMFAIATQELESAVDAADASRIQKLLTDHSGQVFLNENREAIQAVDCHGNIVASLAVSNAVLTSLTNRTAKN